MIIGIQRGLEGIKEKLEERGYKVVYEDEYNYPVDAYIYIDHPNWMEENNSIGVVLTSSVQKRAKHKHNGILFINGKNKSIDEIEQIINNRVYSPLF
ncbi:YkuS family protein [Defluviitalea phaphyphila]|uniref:YkuS family protein n=1 Tax=Defluviitalea phaphyphila TaxID=1473580 RepID=UPI0007312A6F|nr:YkuS family protein [Defluviitalea phaphyphila]